MTKNGSAGPHGQFEGDLAELALGVRDGGEQVGLLEHVAPCRCCAASLQHLEGVVHGLLSLSPEADPPGGFDRRVLERGRPSSAPSPALSIVHLRAVRRGGCLS